MTQDNRLAPGLAVRKEIIAEVRAYTDARPDMP